ncbi:hypothetical protein ACH4NO_28140 [Streptomyces olivaceus]|uniref:hypothetical protein n=1 Tax=Streptomyces olivaceus TaxID=47716 RepID=UPI0004CAD5EB|nr:hypothetical protein [Streptomyces olivaceus]MBZ6105461.1 hypothetical protein [Streptomyces olivaceus]
MSESTTQSATELASQYSTRVTDDLERNVKEQERVSTEITDLQRQLAALQHDHALLVNMQQALGITAPPAQSVTAPDSPDEAATVPAPRDGAPTGTAAGKRSRSRKAASSAKRTTTPKPSAGKPSAGKSATTKPAVGKPAAAKASKPAATTTAKATAKTAGPAAKSDARTSAKTTGKPAKPAVKNTKAPKAARTAAKPAARTAQAADRPTLVELVRHHLAGQSEPRSAAEVTTALGGTHPERTVKTTVVRTTLEGLVARNQAQRSKQGTSVYYTAADAPDANQKQQAPAGGPAGQSDN